MLTISSDLRRTFTTHSQHVEQSLSRIETGFSSINEVSERIDRTTVETKDRVEDVANMLAQVDRSIQELRNDLPGLLEEGIGRTLEKRVLQWMKTSGPCLTLEPLDDTRRAQSLIDSDLPGPIRGELLPLKNTVRDYPKRSEPELSISEAMRDTGKSDLFSQQVASRQTMNHRCIRKKTYLKNFTLPIGFIQTKTVQRIYHDSDETGRVTQDETVRMEITVVPFRWLSSRGRIVSIEKVYDQHNRPSWTYTPRAYNILPDSAMIVLACQNRDIDTVRKLFEYQQASPFDVSSDRMSLMAHALKSPNLESEVMQARELIKFLVSQGADPTAFVDDFLNVYHQYTSNFWILDDFDGLQGHETTCTQVLDEVFRLCLESCHADPFWDTMVLEKLWDLSLGGQCLAPLDPAYLFQEKFNGLENLVFENPDKVFSDLMKDRDVIGCGSDAYWQRSIDQFYETLVFLCSGGNQSIKAKVFATSYSATVPWMEDSCFCPSGRSHLLSKLLHRTRIYHSKKSRQKALRHHVHRMLIVLLQNGEDPEMVCDCKASWQSPGGYRSATDIAADEGILETWLSALEETGCDVARIHDEWCYGGIQELFEPTQDEPTQEKPSSLIAPLTIVGKAIHWGLSSIV